MDESQDDQHLAQAWNALNNASTVAGEHLGQHDQWDLFYVQVGQALTVIQAVAGESLFDDVARIARDLYAGDGTPGLAPTTRHREPDRKGTLGPSEGPQRACTAQLEAAAESLQRVDLRTHPGVAVAISAALDARHTLHASMT